MYFRGSLETNTWASMTIDEVMDEDLAIFKATKAYRLAQLGKWGVKSIVERLNLGAFFEVFEHFNPSRSLPYHNQYHSYSAFLNCYEGSYYIKLPRGVVRGMCAGGLFHDYAHSGGEFSDVYNIETALQGLEIAQKSARFNLLELTTEELQVAKETIMITQYPYTKKPTLMHEMIIRDADLMQAYEENDDILKRQYLGLMTELKITDQHDFRDKMIVFLDGITWETEWAIKKAEVRGWENCKFHLKKILES
jgi:hypothetical protein